MSILGTRVLRTEDPRFLTTSFDVLAQAFLLSEQWWQEATTGRAGAVCEVARVGRS